MPPRKRKEAEPQVAVEFVEEAVAVEEQPVVESVTSDVRFLRKFVWNARLEDMQAAVSAVQGDEGTMAAVAGVLKSRNAGEASQYIQQILQRNS